MTEEEAKTKWCPFVRVGDGNNRFESGPTLLWKGRYCIGSDCMAWRASYAELQPDKTNKLHGYCGLAGATKPWA